MSRSEQKRRRSVMARACSIARNALVEQLRDWNKPIVRPYDTFAAGSVVCIPVTVAIPEALGI